VHCGDDSTRAGEYHRRGMATGSGIGEAFPS
jgi:hypothetical protein